MTEEQLKNFSDFKLKLKTEAEVMQELEAVPLVRQLVCREIDYMILQLYKLKTGAEQNNRNNAYIKGVRDAIRTLDDYERQWKCDPNVETFYSELRRT